MKLIITSIFDIILLIILACFFLFGIIYSLFSTSWDFYYLYLIYGLMLAIPFGTIVGIIYTILSIKNKKFNILCLYIIPILISIFISIIMFAKKSSIWNDEMYKIADIVENYYLMNGIKKIEEDELIKLGIKEKIYITINEDQTYYIVNKRKNIVYRSEYKDIIEEDSDF